MAIEPIINHGQTNPVVRMDNIQAKIQWGKNPKIILFYLKISKKRKRKMNKRKTFGREVNPSSSGGQVYTSDANLDIKPDIPCQEKMRLSDQEVEKMLKEQSQLSTHFASRLMHIYFSSEELIVENLSELDSIRVEYIREHVLRHFKNDTRSNEQLWQSCVKYLNNRIRQIRCLYNRRL